MSARSCSETAPNVTSGIAARISPAGRSSRQISRRISRRRGEAIAVSAAVSVISISLVITKILSRPAARSPQPDPGPRIPDPGLRFAQSPHHRAQRAAGIAGDTAADFTKEARRLGGVAAGALERLLDGDPLQRHDFFFEVHRP